MTQLESGPPRQRSIKPKAQSLDEAEQNASNSRRRETMRSMQEARRASIEPEDKPSHTPETVRHELLRYAEQAAQLGRVQDTMTLMTAARVVRAIPEQEPARRSPTAGPPELGSWMSLSQFDLDIMPATIRSPDGRVKTIEHWVDMLAAVAGWLIRQRLLSRSDCPVTLRHCRNPIIVHETPYPKRGQQNNHRPLTGNMHLYVKFNRQEVRINCRSLLRKFGVEPDTFHIRMRTENE